MVRGLWDSWDDGAIIADKATGAYIDESKVRPLDHKGRFYSVKGPLNIERSPQGHPVIIQAGGSPPGQELSARSADLVFSVVNGDKASAKAAYDSLKQRVVKHGRAPHEVPILPGVMPIIGETDEQAKEQLARLQSWLTPTNALALVSQRIGYDISGYPLDGPVPDFPEKTERGQAFSRVLLDMARREKMTLRDLYNVTAAARGHWVIYGTPKRIADIFEEWFTERPGGRLRRHAGLFPRRVRRLRRQGGAGAAAARSVPDRVCRHDLALASRPGAARDHAAAGRVVATAVSGTPGIVGLSLLGVGDHATEDFQIVLDDLTKFFSRVADRR